MNSPSKIFVLILCVFNLTSFSQSATCPGNDGLVQKLNATLSDAVIHDGFPPPVASRIYAYCHVAGYEAVYYTDPGMRTLSGQLNGLNLYEQTPDVLKTMNSDVVLIAAFCNTAVAFTYREYILKDYRDSLLKIYKACLPEDVYNRSTAYGDTLAKQIIKWSSKDGYKETRNMPKFRPTGKPGSWQPTLPTLGDALEPWWPMIRPFVLDSSGMFKVQDQPAFSTDKNSEYYKQAIDAMNMCSNATEEQGQKALFWDDNPQKTVIQGHLMYNIRQLSPAGHWMGIAGTACAMKQLTVVKTEEICALTCIAMADGFIDCWHEKYRTDRIRPESYINLYIDKVWKPLLETPGFPENPSAHSTISAAASEVLTSKLGADFAFIDSSEVPFDKPTRPFKSFKDAANEAAESRVWLGIHYQFGCDQGIRLGEKIGKLVIASIKTRK